MNARRLVARIGPPSAYLLIVAGPNVPNALLPAYGERYGLAAHDLGLIFSAYLVAIVLSAPLATLATRRLPAKAILAIAVTTAALADAAMIGGSAHVGWILLGRVLAGAAVAFAVGPTADLMTTASGSEARTFTATAAIAGSLIGNALGGTVASLVPNPTSSAYAVHLVALVPSLIAVVLSPRVAAREATPVSFAAGGHERRRGWKSPNRIGAYALGAASWTAAAVIFVLLPSALRVEASSLSPLIRILPAIYLLAAALVATRAPVFARLSPRALLGLMAAGMLLCAAATAWQSPFAAVLGAVVAGVGQDPAYGRGLDLLTRGVRALSVPRTATTYAAIAYLSCAVGVTLAGAVDSSLGPAIAVLAAAGAFLLLLPFVPPDRDHQARA